VGHFYTDKLHLYIIWAAIEEIIKFGAAYFIAFRLGKFREPIDAMIFMITAALGFAALENTLFMLGIINTSDVTASIIDGNWRFIGAVLLHSVVSAIVGFMIALAFYKPKFIKFLAAIVGLCAATALHAAFNLSIITAVTRIDKLKALGLVWVSVIFLIILFQEIKAFEIRGDAEHGRSDS
jgi:RsiW-degrading membrane proteinase PrsW (M82 family)